MPGCQVENKATIKDAQDAQKAIAQAPCFSPKKKCLEWDDDGLFIQNGINGP